MIACFLSNISAKYYKNPSMLSRVIAKNVGDVFFETQCTCTYNVISDIHTQKQRITKKLSKIILMIECNSVS